MGIRRSLVLVLALALVLGAPLAAFAGIEGRQTSVIRTASFIAGDAYEPADDSWSTAQQLLGPSLHTFTSIAGKTGYTADEDWFKVTVGRAGVPIMVNVKRLSGAGGSYLDVYASDGSTCESASIAFGGAADPNDNMGARLLGAMSPGWWASGMAKLYWKAPAAGTYYIRHRPAAGGVGPGYPRDAIPNATNQASSYEIHIITGDADRLAGADRYGTAVAVSRQMWNASDDPWWPFEGPWGDGVILASGENFADGLAATAMSIRTGMPVLLTKRDYLPVSVAKEIERLAYGDKNTMWSVDESGNVIPRDNTFTVYICGSEAAVGPAVEETLTATDNGVTNVKRLEGTDRYGTAAAIADETAKRALYARFTTAKRPLRLVSDTAFVINGGAWPDGLAAGPVAAFGDAPVLMTQRSVLPSVTAAWIEANNISKVYVVGGPSVVETAVMDAIGALSTTPAVERIAGKDRYETARRVAQFGVDDFGMYGGSCTVVSGFSPWDALSAGQLSFMTYGPLLLTQKTVLSGEVVKYYDDNLGFDAPCYVVGGVPTVAAETYATLRDLWTRPVAK